MSTERQTSLDLLREHHTFPGPYTVKVVGENKPVLVDRIRTVVAKIAGDSKPTLKTRVSAGGKHQAVTVTAQVAKPEDVMALYEALRRLPGVSLLL